MLSAKLLLILMCLCINKLVKCNKDQPSIVIIGAGPSGIAAATKLLKNNFTNIKILEAENRIGGRINSVKFGDAFVDLGGEFCHGEKDNIVYSLVKDLNILRHGKPLNFQFYDSNGKHIGENMKNDLFKFSELLDASHFDPEFKRKCYAVKSIGECAQINFDQHFDKYKDKYDKKIVNGSYYWLKSYISSYDSPLDWNDLQLQSEYQKCEGDLILNWNGFGYKTILEVMMQEIPKGQKSLPIRDKIILNTEVASISNWNTSQNQIEILLKDSSKITADHVILTVSAGVLKANYSTLFDPKLPEAKINAIQNVGYGAIDKVVLHFPERWWSNDTTWSFIWTPEDRESLKTDFPKGLTQTGKPWLTYLVGLTRAEKNPKVLIAWYAGDVIPEFEQLSDDVILEGHKYLLNRFLGEHYNVTTPDKILRSKWYSNPHFRGTYSYESVKALTAGGTNKIPDKLSEPLVAENGTPTVLFAGEATNSKYFSTVHGAIETGYREADRLLNMYKK